MFDEHGHGQSRQQGDRQLEAVMGMELQLRQQVAAGNAQECSRAERQRTAEEDAVGIGKVIRAKIKQDGTRRTHQRKKRIQQVPGKPRTAAGRHQSRDRQRVERFVEDHHHGDAQSRQPGMAVGARRDGSRQRQTVEQRVKRQAERGADPGELLR